MNERSDNQRRRRVVRSTLLLALFAFALYAGFIYVSIHKA